jgi:glycosyltransferase involved in cell wall biosynthesis
VYNNVEHLAECIESVLAQSYPNWDYTIVNNCSTDGSGELARRYAAKEPRIKVLDNQRFFRVVANHNVVLRQISPLSKYCKIVFADDWIFPRCIEEMVGVAEAHPSVGIVGAYGLQEHEIMWSGLPYPSTVVSGRDICRRLFLEGLYVFGTSNSVLYRSDLVMSRDPFYNEANFHADRDACVVLLKTQDFGFVHQVLTFTRRRPGSLSRMAVEMCLDLGCKLQTLVSHGPDFLTRTEFEDCLDPLLAEYYNFLAVSLIRSRWDKKLWEFHVSKLTETVGFSRTRLAGAVLTRLCKAALNPHETFDKLRRGRISHQSERQADTRHHRSREMGSDEMRASNAGRVE